MLALGMDEMRYMCILNIAEALEVSFEEAASMSHDDIEQAMFA